MKNFDKALTVILGFTIVLLIAAIVYLSVTPNERDLFTEFYILNSDGKASDYPDIVKVGNSINLIAGIINHEGKAASYRVAAKINDNTTDLFDTGMIQNNGKYEKPVSLVLYDKADKQRIELFLYIGEEEEPHIKDPLVLIVNVIE